MVLLLVTLAGCKQQDATRGEAEVSYVATIHPLAEILEELSMGRAEVTRLLPPTASSHSFEPRPSDARRTQEALAFFYVADGLDNWAARLPAKNRIEVLPLLPHEERFYLVPTNLVTSSSEKDSLPTDPHFWTDPLAIAALAEPLANVLAELDPEGRNVYTKNAIKLKERMELQHATLSADLQPLRGKAIIVGHPSFNYLLRRYGIRLVGAVEPAPGREPSPRHLQGLVERAARDNVIAIFGEPQLPIRASEVLAAQTNLPLLMLDPYGGNEGTETLEKFFSKNAETLLRAIQ